MLKRLARWLVLNATTTRYGARMDCSCGRWYEVSGPDEEAVDEDAARWRQRHVGHEEVERAARYQAGPASRPTRVEMAQIRAGLRGSDSLNPAPARTVESLTPDERAQSARYSDTDFDD